MNVVQGIAAARGLALGPAFQFRPPALKVERRFVTEPEREIDRLNQALAVALRQIQAIYEKAKAEMPAEQAGIFEAHLLMLQDPELLDSIHKAIKDNHDNVEFAVKEATERYAQTLEKMDSDYFKARTVDVRDIARRLLRILLDADSSSADAMVRPSIVIARDLLPSDTVQMDKHLVSGICTVDGSETSHTAILARALGIPAIVGCPSEILGIANGTPLLLDGLEGRLLIRPSDAIMGEYQTRQASLIASADNALAHCHEPAITMDGYRVDVIANIGGTADAHKAINKGAEGVGLLRTEFMYMERSSVPDEDEQYGAYSAILEVFGELPVTLRTSDIGGDKALPYLQLPQEANPFLGVRGLRLALVHPNELLKPQLKAALRAGRGHDLRIMFPMVAALDEIRRARVILEECRAELLAQGKPVAERMQTGIMVEIPSVAVTADLFAPEVDFFSIGTNDLTQYTLAADRTNSQLASYASAFAPSVLRLIQNVIVQGHKHGKRVAICGELAGEPLAIPILLGFGLDEFSMNPQAIPSAKQIIRSLKLPECQQLAEQILKLESADQVRASVRNSTPMIAGSEA